MSMARWTNFNLQVITACDGYFIIRILRTKRLLRQLVMHAWFRSSLLLVTLTRLQSQLQRTKLRQRKTPRAKAMLWRKKRKRTRTILLNCPAKDFTSIFTVFIVYNIVLVINLIVIWLTLHNNVVHDISIEWKWTVIPHFVQLQNLQTNCKHHNLWQHHNTKTQNNKFLCNNLYCNTHLYTTNHLSNPLSPSTYHPTLNLLSH